MSISSAGLLFLPESKTGKKTVVLNAPALAVIKGLDCVGQYVVAGDDPDEPRADLKRPWAMVTREAGLMACAFTTCGIPSPASAQAVAWDCRSSASCWAMPTPSPPRAMRTSMPTRYAWRRSGSPGRSRRQWGKGSPQSQARS